MTFKICFKMKTLVVELTGNKLKTVLNIDNIEVDLIDFLSLKDGGC